MNIDQKIQALYEALSASEKRYITIWLGKEEKEGSFMLQTLRNLAETNGQPKKKAATDKKLFYLYQTILRALRSYHEGSSVNMELYALQMNVEFLYNKRLYDQALHELERLKELARRFNRYNIMLQALELEQIIRIERFPKNMAAEFEAKNKEIAAELDRLHVLTHLQQNRQHIFTLVRSSFTKPAPESLAVAKQIITATRELAATSTDFLVQQNSINAAAIYALYIGDWNTAHKTYLQLLALWDAHPEWKAAEQMTYKKMLSNYLNTCHANKQFDEIPLLLKKIVAIPCKTAEEEAEQFQNIYFMELLYRMNTDSFADFDEYVSETNKGLTKYKTKINHARLLLFYYNISICYLVLYKLKDALVWVSKIIELPPTDHRKDIQYFARLFKLVLLYELGKHDLLEYELINTERYLRQRKAWFAYEAAIVKFLKKLLAVDEPDKKAISEKFLLQITELSEGRNSATMPGISELQLWANSHVTGTTMRELLRAELAKS